MTPDDTNAVLSAALKSLRQRKATFEVFILTGAGISRESGLATFRDAGGIWDQYPLEQVATPEAYQRDPALVHEFYNLRRRDVLDAEPNEAHFALRDLQRVFGHRLTLVTQNVDDLHERAGTQNVIHMHGELRKMRCVGDGHVFAHDRDADCGSTCPECGTPIRPHIVWFGEFPFEMDRIEQALAEADVFCAIGTSGTVYPAAGFVEEARRNNTLCVEVNMAESGGPFDVRLIGPATVQVPRLVEALIGPKALSQRR